MGINEKSLIECPGELKCSETVVTMSGKCFISNFVCSFSDYILLSLSDILYVTFLASNEVNYIRKKHVRLSLKLKLADAVVLSGLNLILQFLDNVNSEACYILRQSQNLLICSVENKLKYLVILKVF